MAGLHAMWLHVPCIQTLLTLFYKHANGANIVSISEFNMNSKVLKVFALYKIHKCGFIYSLSAEPTIHIIILSLILGNVFFSVGQHQLCAAGWR